MFEPIPVTLLTGFLGAGKTTLLNRLLHDPSAGRIAVIVNEFGEAGLDHDLIEQAAEDVVLMSAGCICCSIRGDLARTLVSLIARRSRGELDFDRVVIETTGLADPGPIHHTLLMDRVVAPNFALDGIVTVVDCVLGASTLDRHAEAQAQVAMADRIVMTKKDIASKAEIRALTQRLDTLNAGAQRIMADKGSVPPGVLFGLGALRRAMPAGKALDWLAMPQAMAAKDPLEGLSGLTQKKKDPVLDFGAPSHHGSDNRVTTASIVIEEPIQSEVFDFWLDTLIALRGPDILRLKGIVHISDVPKPFVFHGVQHIFEPPVPLEGWPEGDQTSRVVVIARDIPQVDLEENLAVLRMRKKPGENFEGMVTHTIEVENGD